MKKVLNGNPIRCVNAFRMHPNVFSKLCGEMESSYGLKSSDKITAVEKLGIFVYTFALGVSNRDVSERFQRSGETISRAFHEILEATTGRSKGFYGLAREMINPRDLTFQSTPHQIINDKRYMPYFKDCIGCIDGTHIGACIPEAEQIPYIGRKGIPTFNVMAVCDFDLCFTFISVGWEGSTHDTRVFLHAINNRSVNFPKPSEVTNNDNISSGTSNEMKQIRNDIATSIWNARRR
ncbi:putative nuclease HARBI1 [Tanacetum coccineum]